MIVHTKAFKIKPQLGFLEVTLAIKVCSFERVLTPEPLQKIFLFTKYNITTPFSIGTNNFVSNVDYCPVTRYEALS